MSAPTLLNRSLRTIGRQTRSLGGTIACSQKRALRTQGMHSLGVYGRAVSEMGGTAEPGCTARGMHKHNKPPANPDEALTYLREGNQRFTSGTILAPNRSLERVKQVEAGQKPFAAFLACADSRVPVEVLFDQGFGDVFVTRVAGNVISPEITGSLEFGTAVLGAQVLYVLGHTKCGAVAATVAGQPVPGVISALYYHISPACDKSGGDVEKAVVENVKLQAGQLATSPVIQGLIKSGKLKLVGGVYDLETGKVNEVPLALSFPTPLTEQASAVDPKHKYDAGNPYLGKIALLGGVCTAAVLGSIFYDQLPFVSS